MYVDTLCLRTLTTAYPALVGEAVMARPRDSQRKRVYDAERAAFPGMFDGHLSVSEMQALIDKWCSSRVLQRRYPKAERPPTVADGRGRRRGGHVGRELRMPRMTRTKPYLLHELAHHLTHRSDRASHGWEYAECMLYLVRVFLGLGASKTLEATYKAHRVKYRQPRKRQLTEEQRQAARERMLAWHAERAAQAA